MIVVGAFEAKTHLSSLLDKVSHGEEILITKRGKAVARLVPVEQTNRSEIRATIDEIKTRRKGLKLAGLDWKSLRDEGRR